MALKLILELSRIFKIDSRIMIGYLRHSRICLLVISKQNRHLFPRSHTRDVFSSKACPSLEFRLSHLDSRDFKKDFSFKRTVKPGRNIGILVWQLAYCFWWKSCIKDNIREYTIMANTAEFCHFRMNANVCEINNFFSPCGLSQRPKIRLFDCYTLLSILRLSSVLRLISAQYRWESFIDIQFYTRIIVNNLARMISYWSSVSFSNAKRHIKLTPRWSSVCAQALSEALYNLNLIWKL